jgi:hypothetical protein
MNDKGNAEERKVYPVTPELHPFHEQYPDSVNFE